ncbi:hypothetical protein [uncultured Microbacterium sp.]|uniref:PIN-like domain-containing protein n=1 Tax=uncultured Microbacterium sp. TaxID=191216 RepID=UPI00261C19E0|nr:hypothetical protein [uncultured Microbacterium sp.]
MADARFLLDRSLGGKLLIARLRGAGWNARTLAEEYGDARAQAMSDDEWIASGTASGFILLAKDHRIASRPLEARAIYMHDARAIAFANGNLTATEMGDLCLQYEKAIHRMSSAHPPFVMSQGKGGLRRKNLNFP